MDRGAGVVEFPEVTGAAFAALQRQTTIPLVPHSNLKHALPNSVKMSGLIGFTPREWSS
jgi:hypothetical protein